MRKSGRDVAGITQRSIRDKPIRVHVPDQRLSLEAASLKCKYRGRISLVDAYILALSKENKCRLITTDPLLKEINLVPTTLISVPKVATRKKR